MFFSVWKDESTPKRQTEDSVFFFFSSDRGEPIHVHVEREQKTAKYWLGPVRMEYNHGFTSTELNKVATLVRKHEAELVKAWHEYFKSGN